MQVIHLADIVIPPQVLAYVTEPMAQLYRIIPISFRDGHADDRHVRSAEHRRAGRAADVPGLRDSRGRGHRARHPRRWTAIIRPAPRASNRSWPTWRATKSWPTRPTTVSSDGPIDLTSVEALADSAPVRKLLNMVMLLAIKDHASDMHFEPFEDEFKIRIKADGVLYEMVPPPRHLAFAITTRIKVMANLDIAERRLPQDGRIELNVGGHPVDMRV